MSFWKRYSPRAILCCASKGVLILLAGASVLGAIIGGLVLLDRAADRASARRVEALTTHCSALRAAFNEALVGQDAATMSALEARWEKDCVPHPQPIPSVAPWLGPVLGGLLAFGIMAWLLSAICSATISYCQAAVDSGRRPWYWLPRIGNPLPPRELRTRAAQACEVCGGSGQITPETPETNNEYRARLGLAPREEA